MNNTARFTFAALGLATALGAAPAMADNNWYGDDPYWRAVAENRTTTTGPDQPFVATSHTDMSKSPYDAVDNYNP